MTSSSLGGYGSTEYSSQAAQAALYAEMFSLKCNAGFFVVGLQEGEAVCTPIRVISTLITMSVASAWFSRRKSIKKLLLFFSHWLSGLLHQLIFMTEATMISVCWAGDSLTALIKTLKFFELASSNMLAITNLAICINLALIVMSHRTLSRVRSASTPTLILVFLGLSLGAAAISVPFWTEMVVSGTAFWVRSDEQVARNWIVVSGFYIEFFVGICMLIVVVWLLIFRSTEVKESWKMHARIRYYFGLTLIATGVNLALGICGTIYVVGGRKE
ncbi:unnamed protein product [Ectocarpus sp. 13 AM-2016]